MTDAIEKDQLNERTRLRNASLWVRLDWGSLMAPLMAQQAVMDSLGQPGIESFMAITDETWGIKESQRDRTYELNQAEITDQRQIARDQVITGLTKLAIQRAIDEYTLAVKVYDSKVVRQFFGLRQVRRRRPGLVVDLYAPLARRHCHGGAQLPGEAFPRRPGTDCHPGG